MSESPPRKRVVRTYGRKRDCDDADVVHKALSGHSPLSLNPSSDDINPLKYSRTSLSPDSPPSSYVVKNSSRSTTGLQFGAISSDLKAIDDIFDTMEVGRKNDDMGASESQDTLIEGDTTLVMEEDITSSPFLDRTESSFGKPSLLPSHEFGLPQLSRKSKRQVLSEDESSPPPPLSIYGSKRNPVSPEISDDEGGSSPRKGMSHSPKPSKTVRKESLKNTTTRRHSTRPEKSKPKRPTKKEKELTAREQARQQAGRTLDVLPRTHNPSRYTLETLVRPPVLGHSDPSDPIETFSSPHPHPPSNSPQPQPQTPPASKRVSSIDFNDDMLADSDDELVSPGQIRKRIQQAALKPDIEAKKQALLRAAKVDPHLSEDEDDLVIADESQMHAVVKVEQAARKQGRRPVPSAEQRVHQKNTQKASHLNGMTLFKRPEDLNKFIYTRVEKDKEEVINAKETKWQAAGGRAREETPNPPGLEQKMATIAASAQFTSSHTLVADEEDEDEDDDEYLPDGSPIRTESFSLDGLEDPDTTMVDEEKDTDTEEEEEMELPKLRRINQRANNVVQSDSEDDENVPIRRKEVSSFGRVLVPDSSVLVHESTNQSFAHRQPEPRFSSPDDHTEDEDKENQLEDKENNRTVSDLGHSFGSSRSAGGLEDGLRRTLSVREDLIEEENDENKRPASRTQSLLPRDTSLSAISRTLSQTKTPSFIMQLQMSSAHEPEPSPSTSFAPIIGQNPQSPAFSQFDPEPASGLQSGFGDWFDATQRPTSTPQRGGTDRLAKLRKNPRDLGLTQDLALQPALDVGDDMMKKADAAFEKEQAFILEEAAKQNHQEEVLYVNDHGFLTQSRPDGPNPEIYRGPASPAPTPTPSRTPFSVLHSSEPSSQRAPLGRIYERDDDDDVFSQNQPRKRIHRRGNFSINEVGSYRPESIDSPTRKPLRQHSHKVPRKELGRSEFVAEEAAESDEDEMFGFGKREGDGDGEEDGAHLDQNLAILVDDKPMDESAVNEEMILEKVREHQEQDDADLEKMHQGVVDGDWRKKKRGTVGFDDSGDEDDDDEAARKARRRMNFGKANAGIKDLSKNPETLPFALGYNSTYERDPDDFIVRPTTPDNEDMNVSSQSPLNHKSNSMGDDDMYQDESGDENGFSEDVPRETISSAEIARQAREMKARGEDVDEFDPHNLDFVDENEAEEEPRPQFKVVTRKRKQVADGDLDSVSQGFGDSHEVFQSAGMRKWAKIEGKLVKNKGTGRNGVGAAVTGHSKAKNGGGSMRMVNKGGSGGGGSSQSRGSVGAEVERKIKKPRVMLNMDRSERFEVR